MLVLKGCRERDIVIRPPTHVQITPELPTATMFYSPALQEIWSDPREKTSAGG